MGSIVTVSNINVAAMQRKGFGIQKYVDIQKVPETKNSETIFPSSVVVIIHSIHKTRMRLLRLVLLLFPALWVCRWKFHATTLIIQRKDGLLSIISTSLCTEQPIAVTIRPGSNVYVNNSDRITD